MIIINIFWASLIKKSNPTKFEFMTFDIIRKNYSYCWVLETQIYVDTMSLYDALKKGKKEIKYMSNNLLL